MESNARGDERDFNADSTAMRFPVIDGGIASTFEGTRYRIVRLLGRGGMGEIYEAEDLLAREHVVLKTLRKELSSHPEMIDRLRIEADALRLVLHPNIVRLLGTGTARDGRSFLVLERLLGRTLREEIAQHGAFPVHGAIACARQLLAALTVVHEAGIVHRDVKPDNLVLCGNRHAFVLKLLDFGIAKVSRRSRRGGGVAPLAHPTRDGACVGTPRYVSPEQARGRSPDRRADIYAAGLVLYALVAGRGPFDELQGVDPLLEAHARHMPSPPSRYAPNSIPPELDRVVMRAIAKDPSARYPDAVTFSRDLVALCDRLRPAMMLPVGVEGNPRTYALGPGAGPPELWTSCAVAEHAAPPTYARTSGRSVRRLLARAAERRAARRSGNVAHRPGHLARARAMRFLCPRGVCLSRQPAHGWVRRFEIMLSAGAFAFLATSAALFLAR